VSTSINTFVYFWTSEGFIFGHGGCELSELVFPGPTDLPDVVSGEEAGGEICWFVFGKECARGI
jgi:hypothetical protein